LSAPSIDRGEERIAALLERAEERSRLSGNAVLVSVSERLGAVDPLEALEASASAWTSDHPDALSGTRMYWGRAADSFQLAGFGAALAFSPEGTDRFERVDNAWSAVLEDSLVDDMSNGRPAVGPTLMGGFSFDPDGPRTSRWEGFPSSLLFLPRVQVTAVEDERWLTTNIIVDSQAVPDAELAELTELRRAIEGLPDKRRIPRFEGADREPLERSDARSADEWRELVRKAVSEIRSGSLAKVVLAREERLVASSDLNVTRTLRYLRSAHPDCFTFGFWHGDSAFAGASPERLVRLDGREVKASSLAGSVRRGATADEDRELKAELRSSVKDQREHEFVRNALCSALADLCDGVDAGDEPSILSLEHVHHLHTAVRARLRSDNSLLDLVARLHPTPAVGGEPREAALRFIRENEQLDRGWYAAPVGWLQRDRGEFAVALRSALIAGESASLFAGCGIVADSVAEQEYEESLLKLRPMETALSASIASEVE
jgi:isochorismate synthase